MRPGFRFRCEQCCRLHDEYRIGLHLWHKNHGRLSGERRHTLRRIIRLQYSGSANGTLLATYESWPNDFHFYQSPDDGLNWMQISAPVLSSIPNWVMLKVEPDLFELPVAVGNLPHGHDFAGAGNCRTNDFNINSHRMEVWYSF